MPKESKQLKWKRMAQVIARLKKEYPTARTSLDYKNSHQLLVSTILSAQCTDKRVNMVTPSLFKKYKTVAAFAYCNTNELSEDCLLYTSPSPRDLSTSRMPSSA